MSKIIDLTHRITDKLPVFPGDKATRLSRLKEYQQDKYNNYYLQINMHAGTHIDGPMHLSNSNKYIAEHSLDNFIGQGSIIDVSGEKEIKLKEKYKDQIKDNSILLLYTGQAGDFKKESYFNAYPVISEEFMEFIIHKKIKILGLDSPSPDRTPYQIHKTLFKNNIFILENLINLEILLASTQDKDFEIIALPLKIEADSSILRVVARIG